MSMPIEKDYPNSMEIMDIKEAKGLFNTNSRLTIRKFIENVSQTHSKKIAANLYDEIKTIGVELYECVFHRSVIEAYAKEYGCGEYITSKILTNVAERIANLYKEKGYTVDWYIDNDCAYFEMCGWAEE